MGYRILYMEEGKDRIKDTINMALPIPAGSGQNEKDLRARQRLTSLLTRLGSSGRAEEARAASLGEARGRTL